MRTATATAAAQQLQTPDSALKASTGVVLAWPVIMRSALLCVTSKVLNLVADSHG